MKPLLTGAVALAAALGLALMLSAGTVAAQDYPGKSGATSGVKPDRAASGT